MRKIICPTDFSEAANNAIEYAANLAQILKAQLEIVNIQLLSAVEPILSGVEANKSVSSITETLNEIKEEVIRSFNISCGYRVETTVNTLEKAFQDLSEINDLIVMGTNGMDDVYQYFFGTNTYHIIKKVKCPLLVIPEGVSYNAIKKIVFAWDYGRNNNAAFLQLKTLLDTDNVDITFLHISKELTAVSDDIFNALKDDIHSNLSYKENIKFERIYTKDAELFPDKINEYMIDSGADLLAITFYDRGMLKNILHGNVTKGLSEMASYPLLVLHV